MLVYFSKMADRVQCCVIGAGVVGLAVSRSLAMSGFEVVILEREKRIGTGISARNSEVIHAGIYYPRNSLKATLCTEGRELLYNYCESQNINHKRIGKLLVATKKSEISTLNSIVMKASNNGVNDLVLLNKSQIYDIEPNIKAEAALFSPSTGIVDSHELMGSFLKDAEGSGAALALNTSVKGGKYDQGRWVLETEDNTSRSGNESYELECSMVVNCAGLASSSVALLLGCHSAPTTTFAKGNYFSLLNTPNPFNHLIYPLPSDHGLGIHATLDLNNQVRFGPDVEWVENEHDFNVNPNRRELFSQAIREYWPSLPEDSLAPSYAGIRPKVDVGDFIIQDSSVHGIPGLINLFGIESPGLTSSMAIGNAVRDKILSEKLIN